MLAYVAKLTRDPTSLRRADAEAVYAAGWSERALYDAVQVCALFNFMNRIVEGTGVAAYPLDPDSATEADLAARRARSYADFGRELGILPARRRLSPGCEGPARGLRRDCSGVFDRHAPVARPAGVFPPFRDTGCDTARRLRAHGPVPSRAGGPTPSPQEIRQRHPRQTATHPRATGRQARHRPFQRGARASACGLPGMVRARPDTRL